MNIVTRLQQSLLPSLCILCGNNSERWLALCSYCESTLPFLPPGCRYCGLPLPATVPQLICGNCLNHPPPLDEFYAPFAYLDPLAHLITQLKFANQWINAVTLGNLMATFLKSLYLNKPKPQAIIPIPLHKTRLAQRGYNQALELARPISKQLNLPVLKKLAYRIKATQPQTEISLTDRHNNIKNAFSYADHLPCHVAVIDDVVTTGHTLRSFCEGLKAKGVKRIDAWICARTLLMKN